MMAWFKPISSTDEFLVLFAINYCVFYSQTQTNNSYIQ